MWWRKYHNSYKEFESLSLQCLSRRSKMRIEEASSFHHLLLLLLISCSYFQYYYSEGCHEEERKALLRIKDSFNNTDSYRLSTWEGIDCCKWDGIECDNSSSRVVGLNLQHDVMDGNGTELLQAVCQFNLIEYLNVANNSLEGVVPPCLGNLTSLTYLDLSMNKFQGNIPSLSGLNALETLRMFRNQFQGNILHLFGKNHPIRMRDTPNLSNVTMSSPWKKLQTLLLGYNELTGDGWDLAQVVCRLSLLHTLSVAFNSLEGVVPPCLGNLTSLTYLDLSGNKFQGNIPSLSRLNALEILDLSENQFKGNILHLFGENHPIRMRDASNFSNATISPPWKKLQWLDLGHNDLTGDGWDLAQVVCDLNLLELLAVQSNSLEGVVPPCLGNLTSLTILNLSKNKFQGNILSLSRLNALERLDLSNNQFQGSILHLFGESHPINLSNATTSPPWKKLQSLDLGFNELTGDGWDLAQVVCHLNLLEFLNVHSNSLEGAVPPCLGNLTSLIQLNLANNKFQGNIPSLSRMNALIQLDLSDNQFQGNIFHLFGENHSFGLRAASNFSNATISPPWKKLQVLDLGANQLTGDGWDLAQAICQLKSLELLSLSHNLLEGRLHPCLGMMHSIVELDLSYNRFQGSVPPIFDGSLLYLDLSSNRLEGDILARDSNMSELRVLKLQNNRFTRLTTLPRHLMLVDLSHNHLSGDIYSASLPLPYLRALLLGGNHLEGKIPKQLCEMELLQFFDLSNNNLSGKIPSCLNNISSMRDKYRQSYEGPIVVEVSEAPVTQVGDTTISISNPKVTAVFTTKGNSLTFEGEPLNFFTGIDLSCNQLTGGIPTTIGDMRNLHALNLSNNRLTGSLPASFQNMKNIESLDLSCNELSGALPLQLTQLHLLAIFNVSFNNLSGSIPFNQQFSTFKYESFMGNVGLCGPQVDIKCSTNTPLGHSPPQPDFVDEDGATSLIEKRLFFYLWVAISYALGFWVVIGFLILNKKRRQKYFRSIDEYFYTSQENFWIILRYFKVCN